MKKILILFEALCLSVTAFATDTIRMMQYNLMYYTDNAPDGCNAITNSLDKKDDCIKTIFQYVQPDVLCVNEIGKQDTYAYRLLHNALNKDGIDYFAYCPTTSNSTGITIGNRLFYDTRKLTHVESYYFTTGVTFFNAYRFHFNSAELKNEDTTYVTFIVAHLKSGSYEENKEARYEQVTSFLKQLNASGRNENFILSGDFNIGNQSEDAFQLLIDNGDHNFIDPACQYGEWFDNEEYAKYHTQSTHSGYESDICFSGGGFDNRYDMILVSPNVYYGVNGVKSINSSYQTIGQDGKRFNQGLLKPANTSGVPGNVLNALYNNSDHLPVVMDLEIDASAVGIHDKTSSFLLSAVNPIRDNRLQLDIHSQNADKIIVQIYSIDGRHIASLPQNIKAGQQQINIPFNYPSGIYIIKSTNSKNQTEVIKLVK